MDNLSAKIIELSAGVYVIPANTNVGVITSENGSSNDVYLIDSGCTEIDGEYVLDVLKAFFEQLAQDFKLKAIITTHGHADHCGAHNYLKEETGSKAASGFGLTTHFYNLINGEIPENAVTLCTIHDYLVALLTGTKPVTHSSDGASLGFYNLKENCFCDTALEKVGIDKNFLPEVIKNTALAGKTDCDFLPDGIPVSVAIGDNQGSFLGSVADAENSVLVNVGTGSQVSFVTNKVRELSCGEIRPLTDDKYIFVGASLCGGRAYAILKAFFEKCAKMLGGSKENLYSLMDEKAENISDFSDLLTVNCQFCGTRENPKLRGSIENIGIENFTPENLIFGTLKGVSAELLDMYESEKSLLTTTPTTLVCSGNGLRKSEIWRSIFTEDFKMIATLPKHSEEAAVGACVFASVASGIFNDIKSAQNALLR